MNVSIIGAGGWGCALAKVLDDNQHTVTVWSKFEEEVQAIQKITKIQQNFQELFCQRHYVIHRI